MPPLEPFAAVAAFSILVTLATVVAFAIGIINAWEG